MIVRSFAAPDFFAPKVRRRLKLMPAPVSLPKIYSLSV